MEMHTGLLLLLIPHIISYSYASKFTEKVISESTVIGTTVHRLPKILGDNSIYNLYKSGDPDAYKHFVVTPEGEIKLKKRLEYVKGGSNTMYVVVVLKKNNNQFGL